MVNKKMFYVAGTISFGSVTTDLIVSPTAAMLNPRSPYFVPAWAVQMIRPQATQIEESAEQQPTKKKKGPGPTTMKMNFKELSIKGNDTLGCAEMKVKLRFLVPDPSAFDEEVENAFTKARAYCSVINLSTCRHGVNLLCVLLL